MSTDALIVTAGLDPVAFARLNALRRQHFPAERNLLSAHLTLFHKLPGEERSAIHDALATVASATAPLVLQYREPMFLGRGVAIAVHAPGLSALRATLASQFLPWLSAQDRAGFRPHVTIQNKVAPAEARALHTRLSDAWQPLCGEAQALQLWRYLGGPWEAVAEFPFTHPADR